MIRWGKQCHYNAVIVSTPRSREIYMYQKGVTCLTLIYVSALNHDRNPKIHDALANVQPYAPDCIHSQNRHISTEYFTY